MKTCHKPGCGAQAIPGQPCSDYNCPQSIVTAEDYRALQLRAERAEALLRECDVVLTLVPARAKESLAYTDGFLQGLQTDYIAPLIKRLRGQALTQD